MSRVLSFLTITLLLSSVSFANELEKFRVITTFTVIADIAQNVAGDAAIVKSITKPDAEIHNYQATPGDLSLIHISEPTRRTSISYAVFCL